MSATIESLFYSMAKDRGDSEPYVMLYTHRDWADLQDWINHRPWAPRPIFVDVPHDCLELKLLKYRKRWE